MNNKNLDHKALIFIIYLFLSVIFNFLKSFL